MDNQHESVAGKVNGRSIGHAVGADGLTKHQRYYRRNADIVKQKAKDRNRRMKDNPQSSCKVEIGTQTLEHDEYIQQSLSFVQQEVASYETANTYYLKIEFRRQPSLEDLGRKVEVWFNDIKEWRGELGQIYTTMLAFRFQHSIQSLRRPVEVFYLQGMHLLCQVNRWFADEDPKTLDDALVLSRTHYRLGMFLFQGLGALGVWTTLLGLRERLLPVEDLPIADYSDEEEDFVEHELLASC